MWKRAEQNARSSDPNSELHCDGQKSHVLRGDLVLSESWARLGTLDSEQCLPKPENDKFISYKSQKATHQYAFVSLTLILFFGDAFLLTDQLFSPVDSIEHEFFVLPLLLWSSFNYHNIHVFHADHNSSHLILACVNEHFETLGRICER